MSCSEGCNSCSSIRKVQTCELSSVVMSNSPNSRCSWLVTRQSAPSISQLTTKPASSCCTSLSFRLCNSYLNISYVQSQKQVESYEETVRKLRKKVGLQRGPHSSVGILRCDQEQGSRAWKEQAKRQAKQLLPIAQQFEQDGAIELLADALQKLFDMVPALREVGPHSAANIAVTHRSAARCYSSL